MTPVFPGASSRRSAPLFTCCSWRRPVPASARARLEGTRRENPRAAPPTQTHSCIMHAYICSASCAVCCFGFFSLSFPCLTHCHPSSAVSQAAVALKEVGWKEVYPMDFYSNQSLGPWAPNHPDNQPVRAPRRQVSQIKG